MLSHRTRGICHFIFLLLFSQVGIIGARAQDSPVSRRKELLPTSSLPTADFSVAHFKELGKPKLVMNRKVFGAMNAAVYGFAFLDMHETMSLEPGLIEHDPLARPFTKLSPPAYYVTGAAMATGVNFVAWKLGHSRRWHKLWWIPQAACAYGNLYGYGTTKARE
jgi:hypothetical protein